MSSARKYVHLPPGKESLEVLCFRDGSLDVCLATGEVFGIKNGKRYKKKLRADKDGYLHFDLNREKKDRRGRPDIERRNGKEYKRWRNRRFVRVNRAVKIKAIAVGLGGEHWRQFVKDLPRGIDVNHIKARDDNRAMHLELMTERANRNGSEEMTEEEWDTVRSSF